MEIDITAEKKKYLEVLNKYYSLKSSGNDTIKYYNFLIKSLDFNERTYLRDIYEDIVSTAVSNNDYAPLKRAFFQNTRVRLLPDDNGGYDHCWQLWGALDLLGCDEYENIYRLFPSGIPFSYNGYPMYVNATNILLCILYNKNGTELYEQKKAMDKALKFVSSKKPKWDRAVVAALIGILEHDTEMLSENLQIVCENTLRLDLVQFRKIQCITAYGITALAYHNLSDDEFQRVRLPEYKNYSKGYITWFLQENLQKELCIPYDPPFEEVNDILKMPIAITQTRPPFVPSNEEIKVKKVAALDADKMREEFIADILSQKE